MENIDNFILLNCRINDFGCEKQEENTVENLFCIDRKEQQNKYDLLLTRIVKYLYYIIPREDVDVIVQNSLKRLLSLFNDEYNLNEEKLCLDISDLFLILEIIDDEFTITSGIDKICRVFRDELTGKYDEINVGKNIFHDVMKISKVTEKIFTGFSHLNVYSFSERANTEQRNGDFILNRFPVSKDICKLKPEVAVNKIFLDLLDLEVNPTQERIRLLMLYSKMIGIARAIFVLCDKVEMSDISEYILNKKVCISLFSKIVTTMKILNNFRGSDETDTNIYLQNELFDIIYNQFPYNLVDYKDNPNYWNYFHEYLNSFFTLNHLIGKQISCSISGIDDFLSKKHVSSFFKSFEFLFDRMFIFIGSLEINYFSSEESSVNYISPFYSIVISEIYSFFKLNQDIIDKNYLLLLTIILQLNFINLIKISFSCINNISNTHEDKLSIRDDSLIPKNLNGVRFFQSKVINGYDLIYFGLRLLHHVFQNLEIDSFSPVTQHIFNKLHITHHLFSIQCTENNLDSLSRLNKLKPLLDEVTILFSQRINREIMNRLLMCKPEITSKSNVLVRKTINREIKRCFYLIHD
ncbi:hypothetical protein FG386_001871 [Cryptosporidium ryanae]|uniref:uncharacterized protein n=1 Tax=Cryptosporidium ryanae TaxID=515981 RepID=UPI00351AA41B|nr:hypothetical protein FG386_001871 [Cryptosporidium ryanae]